MVTTHPDRRYYFPCISKHSNFEIGSSFEWSVNRIYCSELVWKVYNRGAGIKVGDQKKMSDFDLSHPIVQAKVRERFGSSIPMDETVVSPADIFNSPNLETVYQN